MEKKKIFLISLLLIFFLGIFSGCIAQTSEIETPSSDEIPAFSPTPLPLPLPTPVDLNADPMNVVATVIQGAEVLFSEDYQQMAANNAENFSDIKIKQPAADVDGFAFTANSRGQTVDLLNDFEVYNQDQYTNQAILIKFMPVESEELEFIFTGAASTHIEFNAGFPNSEGTNLFTLEYPSRFRMEQNKWYYFLMTMDDESNIRVVVWQEGKVEDIGYYGWYKRYEKSQIEEFKNQRLSIAIYIGGNETLIINQYWILGYEELAK